MAAGTCLNWAVGTLGHTGSLAAVDTVAVAVRTVVGQLEQAGLVGIPAQDTVVAAAEAVAVAGHTLDRQQVH